MAMKRAMLVVLFGFLAASAHSQTAEGGPASVGAHAPALFGLTLGMKAPQVLEILGKPRNALDRVKLHDGQRIISDTVVVGDCKMAMRRSFGFDSSGALLAIGLTYKTAPELVEDDRLCAYRWLKDTFGEANQDAAQNEARQDVWLFGSTKLTLESKGYNPLDFFVLIYYYKRADKGE